MAVNQPTRQQIDDAGRKVFNDFETAIASLYEFKSLMDGFDAARLMSANPGAGENTYAYTQGDVDNLKAVAFQYDGVVAANPVAQLRLFGRRIAGVNFATRFKLA